MKKYAITQVCEDVEKTIVELNSAIQKAITEENRSVSRNLENKMEEMKRLLSDLQSHEAYITQPKFAHFFE